MAQHYRPVRSLLIFTVGIIGLIVWTFLPGERHTPKLGLDLRGGTQVILSPSVAAGETLTQDQLTQTISIIRQRVNSLGVAESEVVAQGSGINRQIIISVPGESGERVVDLVGQTAELRFRQVLAVGSAVEAPAAPAPTPTSAATPTPSGSKLNKSAPFLSNPSPAPSPLVTPNAPAQPQVATPADAQISDELSQQFAKLDCTNEENLVGGSDDPAIDANGPAVADAFEFLFLQHAQQFHLHIQPHVTDLIEKQRASLGLFEAATAHGLRAGKCATFMTKQLTFQQLFGNGCGIDGNKRTVGTA